MIIYKKTQSAIKPKLIDTTSSRTTVYLRKNIIEKQTIDEMNGESETYYEYDEAKMTQKEYEEYKIQLAILDVRQIRADLDYIAFMTGVDLEEV